MDRIKKKKYNKKPKVSRKTELQGKNTIDINLILRNLFFEYGYFDSYINYISFGKISLFDAR